MRLDGFLKEAGLTRKRAKAAVAAGRVTVNGVSARDPGMKLSGAARVTVDGARVAAPGHKHIMLYKPAGYVTAREDARSRAAADLLPEALKRLGPVGRLDKDATGLLILTSDGELAHRLITPGRGIEKRYRATVEGPLSDGDVQRMAAGIALKDFTCLPARLTILSESTAEVVVLEGKYHQVKRMFAALGHPVTALKRLSIGGVALDAALAPGEYRLLTDDETARLYALCGLSEDV
jgi:16S rRNA pseudouridine516 synthase